MPKNKQRYLNFLFGLLVAAFGIGAIMTMEIFRLVLPTQADEPKDNASSKAHEYTNSLINETSPYLLQHAHNPVNWHPWGEEAFAKAKRENKPIFLSVGYSTCYWCHVMEVESFEDPEVAAVINKHFIAIKVDREERPDIDEQFMIVTQLLTQRGGWPNSVWLTPDGKPWMAGTYFPKQRFISVLNQLHDFWGNRNADVLKQADALAQSAVQVAEAKFGENGALTSQLVEGAAASLISRFDAQYGGFGGAPKFPPHGTLQLLFEKHSQAKKPSDPLVKAITRTLDAMWLSGIHDHIGGGFHRYSTDRKWLLPHFEKMLYDNAQLIRSYADGFAMTGESRYRDAVADIYNWVKRDMTSPDGAFYSALDSGEVGKEGEAYVWSLKQLQAALPEDETQLFATIYQFEAAGNFAEEATGHRTGANIPHLSATLEKVAAERGHEADALKTQLAKIRNKLLDFRQTWSQPHKDDKVLTSWNGLMIGSLAHAGRLLKSPEYIDAAKRAADFVLIQMRQDGQLLRSFRNGEAKLPGYLDDYAYFTQGLIELYRATDDPIWLQRATQLADQMIESFEDRDDGGFFFTGSQHEELMVRSKHLGGGGNIPNPNGVAAQVLVDLSKLTGETRYREVAGRTLRSLAGIMAQQPFASEDLLVATARYLQASGSNESDVAPSSNGESSEQGLDRKVGPVRIRIAPSASKVSPGQEASLTITFTIDNGWHLYGKNPDAAFVKPSSVSIEPNAAFDFGDVRIPDCKDYLDPVLKQTLNVYEGEVEITIPATVRNDAKSGRSTLAIEVTTQACDNQRCLSPTATKFQIPIEVVRETQ